MIFGFNIIQGIAEDTAAAILKAAGTEPGQYTSQTPVNNAIRNLCVNRARNHYFLRVDVHAGVLLCGKETTDIQWVRPPDFDRLDESFRHHLSELFGNRCAESLLPLRNWTLWTLVYGMEIDAEHPGDLLRVLAHTDMPSAHLTPPAPEPREKSVSPRHLVYDAGIDDRKLFLYSKKDWLLNGKKDYRGGPVSPDADSENTLRLYLIQKRSDMGYAKRFLEKFEMSGDLYSFLHPLVVTDGFLRAYMKAIGNGDFYRYDRAMEIIDDLSHSGSRKLLTCLLQNIRQEGSVANARLASTDKRNFQKELKLLRTAGINGALIEEQSSIEHLANPLDEIRRKCRIYAE